ncbi:MAG: sensor histidine kinase [Thermoanaerobaculia bacterium]
MPVDVENSEREQTDESLRLEREKADLALGAELALIDETADDVINRARARADRVLAATRERTDRRLWRSSAPPAEGIVVERRREDEIVREERADADEAVRSERAEHLAVLERERNATDRDLLSERARSDDVVATRDEFLSIVSHDIRNMLHGVVSLGALISKLVARGAPADQVLSCAERIQRAATRMDRLVGDLVDVASIHAGTLAVTREVVDPSHVVAEAVDTFLAQASAAGLSLEVDPMPAPSTGAFDPDRVLQVLANLLGNAIKFTPAGGKVVVRLERIGDELAFAVIDTGIGIAEDRLEHIFERFLQVDSTDRRGLGLGLYISKCIVQGHGGRIWAESRLGVGSTFRFTLPIVAPA